MKPVISICVPWAVSVVTDLFPARSIFGAFTHFVSRVYLLNRSDFSHCAFIGHYDIRATAVIHQCYTTERSMNVLETRKISQNGYSYSFVMSAGWVRFMLG